MHLWPGVPLDLVSRGFDDPPQTRDLRHVDLRLIALVGYDETKRAAAALAEELSGAIGRGELFLVYQPRIDIGTRQVVGAEALLRWRHPRYGVLSPEAFLPLADDSGLLVPIGGWALREACRQGRRWIDAGIRVAYDYRRFDASVANGTQFVAGDFAKEYAETTAQLKPAAEKRLEIFPATSTRTR